MRSGGALARDLKTDSEVMWPCTSAMSSSILASTYLARPVKP